MEDDKQKIPDCQLLQQSEPDKDKDTGFTTTTAILSESGTLTSHSLPPTPAASPTSIDEEENKKEIEDEEGEGEDVMFEQDSFETPLEIVQIKNEVKIEIPEAKEDKDCENEVITISDGEYIPDEESEETDSDDEMIGDPDKIVTSTALCPYRGPEPSTQSDCYILHLQYGRVMKDHGTTTIAKSAILRRKELIEWNVLTGAQTARFWSAGCWEIPPRSSEDEDEENSEPEKCKKRKRQRKSKTRDNFECDQKPIIIERVSDIQDDDSLTFLSNTTTTTVSGNRKKTRRVSFDSDSDCNIERPPRKKKAKISSSSRGHKRCRVISDGELGNVPVDKVKKKNKHHKNKGACDLNRDFVSGVITKKCLLCNFQWENDDGSCVIKQKKVVTEEVKQKKYTAKKKTRKNKVPQGILKQEIKDSNQEHYFTSTNQDNGSLKIEVKDEEEEEPELPLTEKETFLDYLGLTSVERLARSKPKKPPIRGKICYVKLTVLPKPIPKTGTVFLCLYKMCKYYGRTRRAVELHRKKAHKDRPRSRNKPFSTASSTATILRPSSTKLTRTKTKSFSTSSSSNTSSATSVISIPTTTVSSERNNSPTPGPSRPPIPGTSRSTISSQQTPLTDADFDVLANRMLFNLFQNTQSIVASSSPTK